MAVIMLIYSIVPGKSRLLPFGIAAVLLLLAVFLFRKFDDNEKRNKLISTCMYVGAMVIYLTGVYWC